MHAEGDPDAHPRTPTSSAAGSLPPLPSPRAVRTFREGSFRRVLSMGGPSPGPSGDELREAPLSRIATPSAAGDGTVSPNLFRIPASPPPVVLPPPVQRHPNASPRASPTSSGPHSGPASSPGSSNSALRPSNFNIRLPSSPSQAQDGVPAAASPTSSSGNASPSFRPLRREFGNILRGRLSPIFVGAPIPEEQEQQPQQQQQQQKLKRSPPLRRPTGWSRHVEWKEDLGLADDDSDDEDDAEKDSRSQPYSILEEESSDDEEGSQEQAVPTLTGSLQRQVIMKEEPRAPPQARPQVEIHQPISQILPSAWDPDADFVNEMVKVDLDITEEAAPAQESPSISPVGIIQPENSSNLQDKGLHPVETRDENMVESAKLVVLSGDKCDTPRDELQDKSEIREDECKVQSNEQSGCLNNSAATSPSSFHDDFPEMTSSEIMPYLQRRRSSSGQPTAQESAMLREWIRKSYQDMQLRKKKSKIEQAKILEQAEKAKVAFHKQRQGDLESRRALNRAKERKNQELARASAAGSETQNVWELVVSLIDLNRPVGPDAGPSLPVLASSKSKAPSDEKNTNPASSFRLGMKPIQGSMSGLASAGRSGSLPDVNGGARAAAGTGRGSGTGSGHSGATGSADGNHAASAATLGPGGAAAPPNRSLKRTDLTRMKQILIKLKHHPPAK